MLRFWQEFRSQKAAEALQALIPSRTTVLRYDGEMSKTEIVRLSQVVPGDIVQLAAGDMVPADLRLIQSKNLSISQATLTGEAMPVDKYDTLVDAAEKYADDDSPADNVLENPGLCFMGTTVLTGTGTAVVYFRTPFARGEIAWTNRHIRIVSPLFT